MKESNYAGQWTALSNNPEAVTVSANSNNGTFTVSAIGTGVAHIIVSDNQGNYTRAIMTVKP